MLILSQRDKRWGNICLGKTKRTLAQVGCTTTAICMAADYFGCYINPGAAAQKISYTADALILWASIATVFSKMKFEWRQWGYKRDMIDAALKHPDYACLLNVDHGGHWVLGIKRLYGDTYWVADPWTGSRKLYSGVVGHATLRRK